MSRIATDLTGRVFGRLHCLERAPRTGAFASWRCKCTCGQMRTVRAQSLLRGHTLSCGCWRREASKERFRKQRAGAAMKYRYTLDDALRDVAANWPASLARRAQEAICG